MQLKSNLRKFLMPALAAVALCACNRSPKEPPITGKASDGAVSMPVRWEEGRRYIFRVDSVTSSQVPRKNTKTIIQAETTLSQELAFIATNTLPDGSKTLLMEVLAVQMETGRDDGVTLSFDSANRVMQVEETPLVQRLRRLVGLKLSFRLSAQNKILRMDGMKDLSDRMSGVGSVRGVAAGVISRYFNQQFYREVVEMGMLPLDPVRIGDSWTVARQSSVGSSGGSMPMEFTYTFRGWQQHFGTNCARLEFVGKFNPNAQTRTNDSVVRRIVRSATSPNVEEGNVAGRSWYDPQVALAVQTIYEQTVVRKSTSVRRVRPAAGTNVVEVIEDADGTNAPPAAVTPTNVPPPVVITNLLTTHQTTNIRLLEIEPLSR